jgi:maltose O-acetyltransferase
MLNFLREFWRAMRIREGRYQLAFAMVREIPGEYGMILRAAIMSRLFASTGGNLHVHEGVRIRNPGQVRCGRSLGIGNDVMLQAGGGIEFGNDVIVGPGVKIWTQNHRSDDIDTPIREQGTIYAGVSIGDDCWIGSDTFIMPGVRPPRGCIVVAGSVVGIKAYKEYSITGGNPARLIGFREGARKAMQPEDKPEG